MILALCNLPAPHYLLFSENVSSIVYFSHHPIFGIALILGLFVLIAGRGRLPNLMLFLTFFSFGAWVFLDSIFWAANRSDVIMFVWAAILLVEPLVYAFCLYTLHSLIDEKDFRGPSKVFLAILFTPLIILLPTRLSLVGFDITNCLAIEGPIALYYTYGLEIAITLWIFGYAFRRYRAERDQQKKSEIFHLTVGIILFLAAFASGNIIGSATGNWDIAQFGLFGMPIFAGFLAYSIVRFQTFNIKLIATQALVTGVALLVGAQFAFIKVPTNFVLTSITFVGVIIFGILLSRSVKREVQQRERLEILTKEMEAANKKLTVADRMKSQFLSFASHQVKSPMTVVKDYADLIKDGSYGIVPDKVKETAQKIHDSADRLIALVINLLDLRRLEEGKVEYNFEEMDLDTLVKNVFTEMKTLADEKSLTFTCEIPGIKVRVKGDAEKLRQVIQNFLDNSIKYTEKGWVKIKLEVKGPKVQVSVSDSGLGIHKDILPTLFEQFNRGSTEAKKIQGTGLGLYIAKQFMEAHHGRVWAESRGPGLGSVFTMEMDVLE